MHENWTGLWLEQGLIEIEELIPISQVSYESLNS